MPMNKASKQAFKDNLNHFERVFRQLGTAIANHDYCEAHSEWGRLENAIDNLRGLIADS